MVPSEPKPRILDDTWKHSTVIHPDSKRCGIDTPATLLLVLLVDDSNQKVEMDYFRFYEEEPRLIYIYITYNARSITVNLYFPTIFVPLSTTHPPFNVASVYNSCFSQLTRYFNNKYVACSHSLCLVKIDEICFTHEFYPGRKGSVTN